MPAALSWFWHQASNSLFVGTTGGEYVDAEEVEPCTAQNMHEGCAVFMRSIEPYKETVITPGLITTIYYKEIQ